MDKMLMVSSDKFLEKAKMIFGDIVESAFLCCNMYYYANKYAIEDAAEIISKIEMPSEHDPIISIRDDSDMYVVIVFVNGKSVRFAAYGDMFVELLSDASLIDLSESILYHHDV